MSIRKDHWETIYKTKDHKKVGWYQESPDTSLNLLSKIHYHPEQSIIDVGCGSSLLADSLVKQGFKDITLVDLSSEALSSIKNRLGDKAEIPRYLCRDITKTSFNKTFDIWHDRAVFHFLTDAQDRAHYMTNLANSLSKNGRAIIGTFSLNGPNSCSELDIVQYDEEKMSAELNNNLEIEYTEINIHVTPNGGEQEYIYFILKHNNI
ncbi:MAG: class I SAM-dependent methyltransferase [gamma proteobacterium symbiont of Lucinoma myriamae]|nr:class I SAM-dependent methyltransferase [gamma proteobacterium symbiont of Lucinoma myriamae]